MDSNAGEKNTYGPRLSVAMERGHGSASSTRSSVGSTPSGMSDWSGPTDNYILSPRRSPTSSMHDGSPRNSIDEYINTPRNLPSLPDQQPSFPIQSPDHVNPTAAGNLAAPPDIKLPLFNIEKDGDPRIAWYMYYDFVVTKNDSYWKLRPGYMESARFPSIRPGEKHRRKSGRRCHRCEVIGCRSKPFSRHYDLERHFRTVHADDSDRTTAENRKESFFCDYPRCPHTEPLIRRDHCREHFREYHNEDLIKRGHDAKSKGKETLSAWLRDRHIVPTWWRCNRCLRRVSSGDPWRCTSCNIPCEEERIEARKTKTTSDVDNSNLFGNEDAQVFTAESTLTEYNVQIRDDGYLTKCGQCKNGFIESDEGDPWIPCPICLPEYQQDFNISSNASTSQFCA